MLPSLFTSRTWLVAVLAAALLGAVSLTAAPASAPDTNAAPPVIPPALLAPVLQPMAGPATNPTTPGADTNSSTGTVAAVDNIPVLFAAMRDFDQRFIPVLVAMAGSNAAPALAAAKTTLAAWPDLFQRCTNAFPDDPRLNDALASVAERLRAGTAALEADQLKVARAAFQTARLTLMEIRARLGVEYLPDYLTRYAQPLVIALEMGSKLNPTNVTRDDLLKVRDYCLGLRGYWLQFIGGPRLEPARYGFTPEQMAELQAAAQAGAAALKALETAFDAGKPDEMLATLNAMEAPYLRVLAAFGGSPVEKPAGQ
jgi:hypothetical protein